MGPYQSRPLKENTRKTLSSEKTLIIIVPCKKLRIPIPDSSMSISKLITLINGQYTSRYPIISLKTIDSQDNLDYWLSLPEKDLTPLDDQTELIAIFYSPIPRKICCSSFEVIKVLGKGSYSLVTLVRKKDTGIMYAMKSIEKQRVLKEISVQQVLTEKLILSSIDHPFICKMHWAFHSNKKLHIIMEYYPGGELFYHLKRVKKFSENHAKFYFCEVLMSLKYLHDKDIAYRDLKPENIVIDVDGHVKLTDFGLSKMDMRGESLSFCGSPEYMSPEMLGNMGHTKIVDLYCIGVLLFELLTGRPPFYDRDKNEMYLKILKSNLEIPSYVSEHAKDLLQKLLEKNPKKRIGSVYGIDEVMRHPWCGDIDFDRLMEKKLEPPFVPDLQCSNIGEVYSGMKATSEFFSDSDPDPSDQFHQFEFNLAPDRSNISKFYFENKSRALSHKNLKTPKSLRFDSSMSSIKNQSYFSFSPNVSPALSINISNDSLNELRPQADVQARILEKIFETSKELKKIPELNSPRKSTNPSYTSSNCNKSS